MLKFGEIHNDQNELLLAQLKLDQATGDPGSLGAEDEDQFEAFRDRIQAIDALTAQLEQVTGKVDSLFVESESVQTVGKEERREGDERESRQRHGHKGPHQRGTTSKFPQ